MKTRHLSSRRILQILIVIAVTIPMLAHAGLLESWLKKGDNDAPQRARYDLEPPLVFDAGELAIDLTGHWKLGGSSLSFDEDSIVFKGGREATSRSLAMGLEARMVGHRLAGGTVLVHRLTINPRRSPNIKLGALEAGTAPVGELAADAPR